MELQYGIRAENKSLLLLEEMCEGNNLLKSRLNNLGLLYVAMEDTRYKQYFRRDSFAPLYLVFDKNVHFNEFKEFLRFIREDYFYLNDYPFNLTAMNSRKHIVVLSMPDELLDKYQKVKDNLNHEEQIKEYLL